MGSDISLTASQRSSLLSLQETQDLSSRTQNRLSSGRRVNSVVDDAVNFFRARALSDRASDFSERKDGIDQGVSSIQAALTATESVDSLLSQLKGIAEAAKSQTLSERASATSNFESILGQINQLVEDSSYQGLNLLNSTGSSLDVSFGVRTASRLSVDGFDLANTGANTRGLFSGAAVFSSAGGVNISGVAAAISNGFSSISTLGTSVADTLIASVDTARSRLRGFASELGSNVAVLQTRLDFTNNYINNQQGGADKLTLADLNEEGANLSALQTRQQLGIQSLSIAGQQQQAILGLIR